jgi:hypothetical protein
MAAGSPAILVFDEISVTGCYIFPSRDSAEGSPGCWPAGSGEAQTSMIAGEDKTNRPVERQSPGRVHRVRTAVVAAAFGLSALGLAACASAPEPAAVNPAAEAAQVAPLSQSTNVIYVMPVEGLENPLRLVLSDAVAAALRDGERPAVLADTANNQGPTVIPAIEQVRERGSVVWVTTRWKLRAPYGTVVAERQREMVIDKQLWERKSVETVNLILDDAMPAVAAMVHDYVGPLNVADASEPARAAEPAADKMAPKPMPEAEVKADATGKPVQGRPDASEMLPPQVGAPAPPDALQLDLPAVSGSDRVAVPGPTAAKSPPTAKPPSANRPPMVLTPADKSVPPMTDGAAAPMASQPKTETPRPSAPLTGPLASEQPGKEPTPLTAPPPPETMSGIQPGPRDTPVRWGKPSFLVRNVEGAPGDGNKALVSAITAALRGKDLTVTEDPRQAGYEVVGKVDVGPAVNGRQRARITWAVNTIGGQEVGKAVQENVVAAGSLDGSWGQVAVLVTSAAANGIQQLFEAPRPKYTPVGAVPDFPKIPNLPRVPGRALPPPS